MVSYCLGLYMHMKEENTQVNFEFLTERFIKCPVVLAIIIF